VCVAKKIESLTLHTQGCHRASLRHCSSSSSSSSSMNHKAIRHILDKKIMYEMSSKEASIDLILFRKNMHPWFPVFIVHVLMLNKAIINLTDSDSCCI